VKLTNTDIVGALLEITGLYASLQVFETYSRTDLLFKHALTIMENIGKFRKLHEKRKLPFNAISRSQINQDRGERLRAENLGSRYDPSSAQRGARR
jgi:hypothetical protein